MFNDKNILITGGTGTFGQAMSRYLLDHFNPERVIIYSRDEAKQHDMRLNFKEDSLRFFIGDVRDLERLKLAFRDVDIVIHAAALKQVPAAEYNPMECLKTNVIGAGNIIDASLYANVNKVIALSSDKASNPINLYGASKLAADKLFIAANNLAGKQSTRFSIVRYGNVMNSRGSVIPTFKKLISEGSSSLPITDAKMTRFWITLKQGVEFVAKSFARMQGGEIFIPKIPSSTIVDLARAISRTAELNIVGLRPGEKLHEVLCPLGSDSQTFAFKDFYLIAPSIVMQTMKSFAITHLNEKGELVPEGFEYNSLTNPDQLTVEELRQLIDLT